MNYEHAFEFQGGINGQVSALAEFDDGSGLALYAGGFFTLAGGVPADNIAKWDGTRWSRMGSGMNHEVSALTVFDDGSGPALYAGGTFTIAGGVPANRIARWNGATWSALGAGISSQVLALAGFDDGTGPALYAGGNFYDADNQLVENIAKWNGTSWSALDQGIHAGIVNALAVYDDGNGPALFAAGTMSQASGVPVACIAKWDGTSWSSPGSGLNATVEALCVHDDGSGPKLCAGGFFSVGSGSGVASWDGTTWSPLGIGIPPPGGEFFGVHSLLSFEDGGGPALVAGGGFTTADNLPAYGVAKWNGVGWSAMGAGLPSPTFGYGGALTLATYHHVAQVELFAAGGFSGSDFPVANIARWDGSSWSAPVGGAQCNGLDDTVHALKVFDDGSGPALFVGGNFMSSTSSFLHEIARWSGSSWQSLPAPSMFVNALESFDAGAGPILYAAGGSVKRWDGATWTTIATANGAENALAVFGPGNGRLIVGGAFTMLAGAPENFVSAWDGATWSSLGSGMNASVFAFATFDDGSGPALYAGGAFTTAGGVVAPYIAKWNGTSWSAMGTGANGHVLALDVFDDGNGPALYAGGAFTTIGGVSANHVAKWNGSQWSALSSGVNALVDAFAAFDDGDGPALYAGGNFAVAGGTPAPGVAKWNGANWTPLGSGIPGNVYALASFTAGTTARLFIGGTFSIAGAIPSANIAAWRGCSGSINSFCFGDGSVSGCPCFNTGLAGHGCENSAATGGARETTSGSTQPDALVLHCFGELPHALSIYLQGNALLGAPVSFGDGLRCAGGALKRLYVKTASSGTSSAPEAGDPSITARSAALGDPIAPGSTRFYQTYYRDPSSTFCPSPTGDTWNVTNGVRVQW